MSQIDSSEESSDDAGESWINGFCSTNGNIMFCKIDKGFIEDNFNLYGLKVICPTNYNKALSVITDRSETEDSPDEVTVAAKLLYGLVHARYIITVAGLDVMKKKFIRKDFGECPRTHCKGQAVLPMGLSDEPNEGGLKLFCPRCQDIYNCGQQYRKLDGCYFGSTFCNLFFMTYHDLVPELSPPTKNDPQKYVPRVFGFKIHCTSRSLPSLDRIQSSDVQTSDSSVSEASVQVAEKVEEEEGEEGSQRQKHKRPRVN